MKKLLLVVVAVLLAAPAAFADTYCYGWENGATVLGAYLPLQMTLANVSTPTRTGSGALEIKEIADSGGGYGTTPQAYVAWVKGLVTGDVVTANFYPWDDSSSNPSCRIWAHWTNVGATSIDDYYGSAGGNNTYSTGLYTTKLEQQWTVGAANNGMGLVIEIRPYNGATGVGTNFVDDLCVTIPERAETLLYFPDMPVPNDDVSWGAVKTLYK